MLHSFEALVAEEEGSWEIGAAGSGGSAPTTCPERVLTDFNDPGGSCLSWNLLWPYTTANGFDQGWEGPQASTEQKTG